MQREENPVDGFLIGKIVFVDTEERNGRFPCASFSFR